MAVLVYLVYLFLATYIVDIAWLGVFLNNDGPNFSFLRCFLMNNSNEDLLEQQIQDEKRTVDYDTKDYTVELVYKKYTDGIDEERNEIYVPEYQREFVWDDVRQSRLIESLVLGLPIPSIFLAEDSDGRLEIVDGSQRLRTIAAFLNDELSLRGLEKLTYLNDLRFSDLPLSRKRKINNISLRMIVLSDDATDEVKNDLFDRINRGSDNLRNMEKRRGIYQGGFTNFIYDECNANQAFKSLVVLSPAVAKRQENEELILRYFALVDLYNSGFKELRAGVGKTLDDYLKDKNSDFSDYEKKQKLQEFKTMVDFVKDVFPYGFSKKSQQPVSRVYFEAVAIGSTLALRENPNLSREHVDVNSWLENKTFKNNILGRSNTHAPKKIKSRIDFVKDNLLSVNR